MNLKKGTKTKGIVSAVESYGIFLELENGDKGFLPKKEMHVGKNKKLLDLFSVGFLMDVTILSKKEDYYTLTQKEIAVIKEYNIEETKDNNKEQKKTKQEKDNVKNSKKNKAKQQKTQEPKIEKTTTQKSQKETGEKKDKLETKTLADLKKLKTIGNLKISVQKNKQKTPSEKNTNIIEEKIFLEVPKNFIEEIEKSYEEKSVELKKLKEELRERGLLDETKYSME